MEIVGEFKAQEMANTAWAFAKMEMRPEMLMEALGRRALEIVVEFNAQDVSAVFHDIAPGDHTIRLCVMRAEMPDEVDEFRKRINVPIWSALIWEIRR